MKRVLFFLQNGVGGSERMTINIANLLQGSMCDIIICKINTPYKIQNGSIDNFIPQNLKKTNISNNGKLSFLQQLCYVIKLLKPNIVFCSVMPYNIRLLLIAPFFKNIQFIVRNDNNLLTLNKYKRILLKFTYRNAAKIIAQTEEMRNELINIGLNSNKVITLHNFIDIDLINKKIAEASPFPNDGKVRFVSVGRVADQKGYDILIKAFKIVLNYIPNAELYIVGDIDVNGGRTFGELKDLVKMSNLQEKVFFTGYTNNPYIFIKNASVYVLSSRYEGLPNTLVEALYLNIPAAATKCIPIISRMIQDGENGYLAESENSGSLAQAMLHALQIKKCKQIYHPSSKEDFLKIFEFEQ